jgi:hypothetical protein
MEQNDHKKLVCVIVGTNRSGKTTIFNLLSRSDQAQSSEEIIIPKNITLSEREFQSMSQSPFGLLPTEILNRIFNFIDERALLRCLSVCKSFLKLGSTDSLWRVHLNKWLASNSIATPTKIIESAQSIKRLVKWLNISEGGMYRSIAPDIPDLLLVDTLPVNVAVSYTKTENFSRVTLGAYGVGILCVNPNVFKSMSIVDLIPNILSALHAFAVTQDRILIVAVNRLDEFSFMQQTFNRFRSFLESLLGRHGVPNYYIVPINGKTGENVITEFGGSEKKMPWYIGPSIQQILAEIYTNRLESWSDKNLRASIRTIKRTTTTSIITFVCVHCGIIRTGDNLLVGDLPVSVESIEQEGGIVSSVSASDWAVITLKGNTVDQIQEGALISTAGEPIGELKKFRVMLHTFHTIAATEKFTLITSSFAKRTVRVVAITKLGTDEHSKRYTATLEIERDAAVPVVQEPPKKLGRFVLLSIVKNAKILNSPILMAAGIFDT